MTDEPTILFRELLKKRVVFVVKPKDLDFIKVIDRNREPALIDLKRVCVVRHAIGGKKREHSYLVVLDEECTVHRVVVQFFDTLRCELIIPCA